MAYLGLESREQLHWALLRLGMASVSDTFIVQMQDYLELGEEARMNTPGSLSSMNWSWRMERDALGPQLSQKIRTLTQLYERL
jgi:4-alpha-glucanotransferase